MSQELEATGRRGEDEPSENIYEPMPFRPITGELLREPVKSKYGLSGLNSVENGGTVENVKRKLKTTFISREVQYALNRTLMGKKTGNAYSPVSCAEIEKLFADNEQGTDSETKKLGWYLSEGPRGEVEGFLGEYEKIFHRCFGSKHPYEEGLYPSLSRGPISKDCYADDPYSEHENKNPDRCRTVARCFEDIWDSGIISESERCLLVACREHSRRVKRRTAKANLKDSSVQDGNKVVTATE